MRMSDWSTDVCSADLASGGSDLIDVDDDGCGMAPADMRLALERHATSKLPDDAIDRVTTLGFRGEALPSIASVAHVTLESRVRGAEGRSEEHTSELQSLMRISYAVFCLKKKKQTHTTNKQHY